MVPIRSNPPRRKGKEWLELYNTSPRLTPITKMSIDISVTKGKVYRKKGAELIPLEDHPLLDLLYQPNEVYHLTGSADLYLSQVHYLVRGESFAIIERDKAGNPEFLWFIPPGWVKDTPTNSDPFYLVNGSEGSQFRVAPEDMFYRKNPNPLDPTGRGIGRVEQIGDEVETDEYMAKFAKRFFFNDATPNILITAPDETDDEEIQNAERRWFQKFGGIGNSNKAAFLNWDAKVHILNTSNREMDFVESRKFYRDLAIQHFGIPPEIMGNVENSNKATVVAAQDIYLKQVIHPQLIEFEEVITWQLLKQFKNSEDLIFLFDRETVEDKEFEMKSINEAYQLGGITIDEYRGRVGDLLNMNLAALPNGQGNRLIFKGKITIIDLNTEEIIDGSTDEGGEPQDEQDKKFIIDDSG
jgi:HK97 family phage portal protein